MPLVTLQEGTSSWGDIKDAADVLWRASHDTDIKGLCNKLQGHYADPALTVVDLHTGINNSRRALVVQRGEKITIAFEGSHPEEIIKNMWVNGKGSGFWELPYPVFIDGNRVHSFYRDMWHAMRTATFDALGNAIRYILAKGASPQQIIIAGHSMGGGVSILAFTDILEHIRSTYGCSSPSPQLWASDSNLGSIIQHLTFAAVAAADQGYYTRLNQLYERYQIRAWDFMNHVDWTAHSHHLAFRSWRGHRYILPDAVVQRYFADFGPQGHFILGYLKAAEWMAEHGTDQVKSAYSY